MFLVVGLGNPGKDYEGTRHNVGFAVLDTILEKFKGTWETQKKIVGDIARVRVRDTQVWMLKPQTYMNLSGEAVRKWQEFYKPEGQVTVLLIHDEVDIALGKMKIQVGRGAAGHRGVASVMESMTKDVNDRMPMDLVRLRVGVGKPGQQIAEKESLSDLHEGIAKDLLGEEKNKRDADQFIRKQTIDSWVLERFSTQERAVIDEVILKAGEAVEMLVVEGVEAVMNRFNG